MAVYVGLVPPFEGYSKGFSTTFILAILRHVGRRRFCRLLIIKKYVIIEIYFKKIMAMEATHVLFARDLQKNLSIEDASAFFAGCIYPDSRYVTRISRDLTHGADTPQNPFANGLSDFEKGWGTHFLYDHLEGRRMRELLAGDPDSSREALITMTAMKLLEDQQSYDRLGDEAGHIFKTMRVDTSPKGEDVSAIRAYFEMNTELYAKRPELDDYRRFFQRFIPSPEYGEQVIREAQRLSDQQEMKREILAIYDRSLEESYLFRSETTGELLKR